MKQPKIIKANGAVVGEYIGGILKRISPRRFEGYGIRWHDPSRKDLQGEWFSSQTNRMIKQGYPIVGIPVNYQHGLHKDFGAVGIGILDFTDEDEVGQFVRGEIKERQDYIEMLKEIGRIKGLKVSDTQINRRADLAVKAVDDLLSNVDIQFSGGFDPSTWIVNDETKHIDQAGMIHLAFTPTPADDLNPIVHFKSIWNEVHDLQNERTTFDMSIQTAKTQGAKEPNGAKELNVPSADVNNDNLQAQGTNTMDENAIRDIIRMVLDEQKAMDGMEEELPEEEDVVRGIEPDVAKMEEEEIDDEQKSVRIAELAAGFVVKKLEAAQRQKEAIRKAAKVAFGAYNASLPTDDSAYLPTAKHNNGQQPKALPFQIRDITPFDNWKAEDYSFAVDLARMSRGTAAPVIDERIVNKAFMNQFADKAVKAYENGEIRISKGGMKAINAIKADELDYSTQAGFGDEWVFTAWSESIWDKPRLDLVYNQLQTVNMPSNPYEVPTESTDPSVYFVAETTDENQLGRNDSNAAIPDTKIATSKVQLNAKKYAMRVNWSAELGEDAIASYLPKFRNQAQRAVEDAIELGVLLGDTSTSGNINDDGGTPTATNSYLAYDGLWHQALVTATTNAVNATGAAPTLAHIRNVRSKLGNAQGYNPANLAIFTDFPTYMKLLSIDAVVTMDKIGNQATVKTGSLGQIDGINIFVSGQMALADTDGKITNGGNVADTGRLMVVYLPDWYLGYRRRVASHLDYLKFADAWELVLTVRTALSARSYNSSGAQQSSDDSVAVLYNIGV